MLGAYCAQVKILSALLAIMHSLFACLYDCLKMWMGDCCMKFSVGPYCQHGP